ncbi:hypothetical protein D3C71_2199250 [compost metagenome]
MRVNFFEYENKSIAQVYITSDEIKDINVINEIEILKKNHNRVAIMISGLKGFNDSMKNIFKDIK